MATTRISSDGSIAVIEPATPEEEAQAQAAVIRISGPICTLVEGTLTVNVITLPWTRPV